VPTDRLYFKSDRSDKVYILTLEQHVMAPVWVLCSQWGRRGAQLQGKQFRYSNYNEALMHYNELLEDKLSKGYVRSGAPNKTLKELALEALKSIPVRPQKEPASTRPKRKFRFD
jgi:predicted DNA-binding WGR domain protein